MSTSAKPDMSGVDDAKIKSESVLRKGAGTGKLEGRLIVKERRTTGSVSWRGRCPYCVSAESTLRHHESIWRLPEGRKSIYHFADPPLVHVCNAGSVDHEQLHARLVGGEVRIRRAPPPRARLLMHVCAPSEFNRPNSFYQTLYACLGIAQSLFTFGVCVPLRPAFLDVMLWLITLLEVRQWMRWASLSRKTYTTTRSRTYSTLRCHSLILLYDFASLDLFMWLTCCLAHGSDSQRVWKRH